MPCEKPLTLLNPRYKGLKPNEVELKSYKRYGTSEPPDLYITVPCGYCHSCRKKDLQGWRFRLLAEFSISNRVTFVTFTFDEDNLGKFRDNPNRAILLWLDRVRKKHGKGIRHFIVAEYGKKHGRLHYHGLLFDLPQDFDDTYFQRSWSYGRTDFSEVRDMSECSKYVCKYITKDPEDSNPTPRKIVSKGLGECYVRENVELHKNGSTLIPYLEYDGIKHPLPRYYSSKIFTDDDKAQMILEQSKRPFEQYLNGEIYTDEEEYRIALRAFYELQVSRGITAKYKPQSSVQNKTNIFDKVIKANKHLWEN